MPVNRQIPPSDQTAIDAICSVRPVWHGQCTANRAIGLSDNVFLHAGPPFRNAADICRPILNSACCAAVFEGIAKDFRQAEAMILSNEIELLAAQDFSSVVPLAGVISPSMQLHEIIDSNDARHRSYAPINGGSGPAMRLGQLSTATVEHLHWLNGNFNDDLQRCFEFDIDLIQIATAALRQGDDCHGRTPAATAELIRLAQSELESHPESQAFLNTGPSFFLNLWMAACKCMLTAGNGIPGSGIVTAAAGNGAEFGIKISGDAGMWHCAGADPPTGNLEPYPAARALGAIGDSAIVDAAGFGAMALSFAPAQQTAMKSVLPDNAMELPELLLGATHPAFSDLSLRTALSSRLVRIHDTAPIVSLGILDNTGEAGRIAGGIYTMPKSVFHAAMDRIDLGPVH